MNQEPVFSLQVATRLRTLFFDYDFEFSEFFVGLFTLLWGLWLLNPLLDTFTSSPSFRAMLELGPEWVWGLVTATIGGLQLAALIADRPQARKHLAMLLVLLWMFVSGTFAYANVATTAAIAYPMIAFCAAWVRVRLALRY